MAYTDSQASSFPDIFAKLKAVFAGLAMRIARASDERAAIIGAQIDHLKAMDDAELAARGLRRGDIELHVFRSKGLI